MREAHCPPKNQLIPRDRHCQTREAHCTPRESPTFPLSTPWVASDVTTQTSSRYCTPCTIPHTDVDFAPLRSAPITESFPSAAPDLSLSSDPIMEKERQKQFRLLTIHERLGHVSFVILRLMARCGLIPRDLANVSPPCCPRCAYSKARRRPTRYKGHKNRYQIRPASQPGH